MHQHSKHKSQPLVTDSQLMHTAEHTRAHTTMKHTELCDNEDTVGCAVEKVHE